MKIKCLYYSDAELMATALVRHNVDFYMYVKDNGIGGNCWIFHCLENEDIKVIITEQQGSIEVYC